MDERVKAYLDAKRAEEERAETIYREKVLIAEGLCEREYSPTQERISREYPKWDCVKNKAYREIPLQVTEDEFREIEEYWEIDKYVAQNKKEKTDVSMIIMKRYVLENRKNYFMKSFCRLGTKTILLRIPKMESW